jgi:hypothetical protein
MGQLQQTIVFALCIENRDCDDLEKGKVYQVLSDDSAAKEGYLRVLDESAEDYLYPESYFVLLDLPEKAENALLMTA